MPSSIISAFRLPSSALLAPVLAVLLAGAAPALEIGEKAPSLNGVAWLKGAAPAPGMPTVVEFWATWCGPCKTSIPHLSALAKANAGKLAVAGLSDEDQPTVAAFIATAGMDYNVGLISEEPRTAWMDGVPGIPHAFLVGADGTVLWHGHPVELDPVVAQVLAGTWDPASAKKLDALRQRLQEELSDADVDDAAAVERVLATAREILAQAPADSDALGVVLGVAQHQGDRKTARAVWEAIPVDRLTGEQAATLAQQASEEQALEFRHLGVALRLASRAVELAPEAEHLEILARVHYACGRIEDAIASQERALHAATGDDPAEEHRQQAVLEYYIEVLRLRAGAPARPDAAGAPATIPPVAPTPVPAPAPGPMIP